MIDDILEDVRGISHEGRFLLWRKLKAAVAEIEAIEEGDPDPVKVRLADYRGQVIVAVAESSQGLAAMDEAIDSGLPPLAGIDPILRDQLGPFYRSDTDGAVQAGYALWRVLKSTYDQGPQASMPFGFIAKTGTTALKKES